MEDTAPIESPREANVNSGPFCLHPSTRENLLELGPAESFAGLSEKKKNQSQLFPKYGGCQAGEGTMRFFKA